MSLIDCSKVYVKSINEIIGKGAFAFKNIKKGELVEYGIMSIVKCDGNINSNVFTWSTDRTVWAIGSGCSTFYNTSKVPNCIMKRYFDENRFEIYVLKDIKKDEELTHKYRSLEWRDAFSELNKIL